MTASQLVNELCEATGVTDDGGVDLSCTDIVSLVNLSAYVMRGASDICGEAAFQQGLGPYLISSAFSPMLEGSRHCHWFSCVPTRRCSRCSLHIIPLPRACIELRVCHAQVCVAVR